MCELIFVLTEKFFESYDLGFHCFVQAKWIFKIGFPRIVSEIILYFRKVTFK